MFWVHYLEWLWIEILSSKDWIIWLVCALHVAKVWLIGLKPSQLNSTQNILKGCFKIQTYIQMLQWIDGLWWRVRLSYRDEKAEMSMGENSAVRPRRKVYTQPIGQLLRGRTLEYGQGTLFIMRKGALRCMCKRCDAYYGLGMWVVMSADMQ